MIRFLGSIAAVVLILNGMGCATPKHEEEARVQTVPATSGAPMELCAHAEAGTVVSISDTMDGVALTFHNPRRLGDVRDAARRRAELHNQEASMAGSREQIGMVAGTAAPPSRAAVEDVEDGARIVLVPTDVSDLDALRAFANECGDKIMGRAQP